MEEEALKKIKLSELSLSDLKSLSDYYTIIYDNAYDVIDDSKEFLEFRKKWREKHSAIEDEIQKRINEIDFNL
jgi:hypothetical protein